MEVRHERETRVVFVVQKNRMPKPHSPESIALENPDHVRIVHQKRNEIAGPSAYSMMLLGNEPRK